MQALKLRSGSSEMAHKTPSRTTKGSPISSDSSELNPSKVLERKPSSKSTSLPEKRTVRVSATQQHLGQLQEELKKAKEEKSQALEELKEMQSQKIENEAKTKKRVEMLELGMEKAKESERKMLESLISQTKQLEQTKIALEEAKLEIRSLQESIKTLEGSASRSSRNLEKHLERNGSMDVMHAQEQIRVLKNELKLATEAEEKSKKAMDDLAIALKEVTMEANQAKRQIATTQSELESMRAEAERLKALLKITEEKFREAVEESEQVKLELEESVAAWNAKENGFINCMKVSEEEISKALQENDRLIDSQRVSREDNSKLRDIIKQAVNESTVVKEALEIARRENSQLKDLLSEKENALQSIKQEYGCLKVSEAAALDSVKELQGLLAATSTMDSSKIAGSPRNGSFMPPTAMVKEVEESKGTAKFPSDCWKRDSPRVQNGRRHSVGEDSKFKGSVFDTEGSLEQKHRMLASVSNVTDLRVPSSLFSDDGRSVNFDDFDHIDMNQLDSMRQDNGTAVRQKKKRPLFRRFGDLLRRSSFHK